jgi:dTDP-4-amino-4,6-dideoxygalactose transaminase
MIPRHRPPFGMAAVTACMLPGFSPRCVEQLEQDYADTLNVPHAIWLPSARSGIYHAINSGLRPQDQVYCPAFTCKVVHQAIRRSGRTMELVDCSDNSLLMDTRFLQRPTEPDRQRPHTTFADDSQSMHGYGVVLSEVFGYRYSHSDRPRFLRDADLRIFDMAMCIPTATDMQRLIDRDVALISFGLGKSLYAGWGGMAFTRDHRMAARMREQRDQDLRSNSTMGNVRQVARVWLRTFAHSAWLYKFSRRIVESRSVVSDDEGNSQTAASESLTPEWSNSPTNFHLKLASENLKQSALFISDRREYAEIYRTELSHLAHVAAPGTQGWLTLLPDTPAALSHFCLRVHSSLRDPLRQYLWRHGIDTSILFPFPEGADSDQLQNTHRLTRQIIGLPLSNGLGRQNIRRVCLLVRNFIATQSTEFKPTHESRNAA